MLTTSTLKERPLAVARAVGDKGEVFIYTTYEEIPFDPSQQTDLKRLTAGGAIQLGADMAPSEYVLQITVNDLLADQKHRTAAQWMDFEI